MQNERKNGGRELGVNAKMIEDCSMHLCSRESMIQCMKKNDSTKKIGRISRKMVNGH
jgi:hypothetical protein